MSGMARNEVGGDPETERIARHKASREIVTKLEQGLQESEKKINPDNEVGKLQLVSSNTEVVSNLPEMLDRRQPA